MLRQAAIESASHSRFKPEAVPPDVVEVVYEFVLEEPVCNPSEGESGSRTDHDGNIVTVKGRPPMFCITSQKQVRSARCLYLWRCSTKRLTSSAL